jgi:hypothetical protein
MTAGQFTRHGTQRVRLSIALALILVCQEKGHVYGQDKTHPNRNQPRPGDQDYTHDYPGAQTRSACRKAAASVQANHSYERQATADGDSECQAATACHSAAAARCQTGSSGCQAGQLAGFKWWQN